MENEHNKNLETAIEGMAEAINITKEERRGEYLNSAIYLVLGLLVFISSFRVDSLSFISVPWLVFLSFIIGILYNRYKTRYLEKERSLNILIELHQRLSGEENEK